MIKLKLILTSILLAAELCAAYKFLVAFPFPGGSHAILGHGYVRHLLNAGHEVTYITAMPIKNPSPKLRQIDVSSNFELMTFDDIFDVEKLVNKESVMQDVVALFHMMLVVTNASVMHDSVQRLMHDPKEHFDAVIVEWMFSEIYSGFSAVFDCPLIWSSSMEPHHMVLSLIDEDMNSAYSADMITSEVPPFTFWQRVQKLLCYLIIKVGTSLIYNGHSESYNNAFTSATAKRGRSLPPLNVLMYNGSLMLGNSHVSTGQAVRLPQNYIPIAGYHIEDWKPLPQDIQKILDNAKHGAIYFSMGSMLKSKRLPVKIKRGLIDMFGSLKQTVIWKFEEKIQNLPKNVHIVDWAPQQSILAHMNCVLFITHGGLLSTIETLHFGVPIIGMPMYADQFNNVNRATDKGFAKRVDLDFDTPVNLKAAIEDILENPRYRERVKELSLVYHDRVVPPGIELVHWVEHVVRTRGAPHLRSVALLVPWYQKMYLDLLALVLAVVLLLKIAIKRICCSQKEVTAQKKKN